MFKKEIFSDIVNMMWQEYQKSGDNKHFAPTFLALLEDFPDLKQLFDNYYQKCTEDESLWSDKKIILRFLRKITIIYETFESQTTNV